MSLTREEVQERIESARSLLRAAMIDPVNYKNLFMAVYDKLWDLESDLELFTIEPENQESTNE